MKKILKWLIGIIVVLLLLFLIMKIFFPIFNVKALEGKTKNKEHAYTYAVVSRFHYNFFSKKNGDTVIFKNTKGILGGDFDNSNFTIFKINTIGEFITIYNSYAKEKAETLLNEGYKPSLRDGFDDATGIISNDKIIGKVILTF